jgi:tryptophan halogenase
MNYNDIKFLIIGGGTAGWIAAINTKKIFPENSVTVIESSNIGILGAGEGTTPHFVEFLRCMDVNIDDFIKSTKATIKDGIKFTNWHGDNEYYFHPFADGLNFEVGGHFNTGKSFSVGDEQTTFLNTFSVENVANGKNFNDVILSDACARQNKTRIYVENEETKQNGSFALHFDARLVADYLKNFAIKMGVKHIDNEVISSNHHSLTHNVTSVILDNGNVIDCDFVFDCTGFARKLIGGIFKQNWIDYNESLPVDRALPFFIQNDKEVIPPYTEAIAMKYGWVWKIPVQGRYGCGYVFDSSYISDDDAKKELTDYFGDVEVPRSFSFKAGFYENVWVKNCVALGLSAGFIEPLEATSIWVTIIGLKKLLTKYRTGIFNNDVNVKKLFNDEMRKFNEEIKDFIQLHYLTYRNDSPFWKEYRTKNKIVNSILEYDNAKTVEQYLNLSLKNFPNFHPYFVFAGVKFYNKDIFKNHFDTIMKYPENKNYHANLKARMEHIQFFANFKAMDHYKLLQHICQK